MDQNEKLLGQDNLEVDDSDQDNSEKKSKKLVKTLVVLSLIAILVVGAILAVNYYIKKEQEAFETPITENDFSLIYYVGDENLEIVITPKYDIENFVLVLDYVSGISLITPPKDMETFEIGSAKAGVPVTYVRSIQSLEEKHGGFDYVRIYSATGMKQNKNDIVEEVVYNTECDFKFRLEVSSGSYYLYGEVTNNTDKVISEIHNFEIDISFGGASCKYSNPRIILDEPLQPNSSMSFSLADGNKYFSSQNKLADGTILNSVSYSGQTYTLVYKKN